MQGLGARVSLSFRVGVWSLYGLGARVGEGVRVGE